MATVTALPLFHLYGDPPAIRRSTSSMFETIASRSAAHDWLIPRTGTANSFPDAFDRARRRRNDLRGGEPAVCAPRSDPVPPTTGMASFPAQGDRRLGGDFTEDVAEALGERSGEALKRLKALAAEPVIPLGHTAEIKRLATGLCADLHEESFFAREGFRLAMRGLLALIAIEVARLAASRARTGVVTLAPGRRDRRSAAPPGRGAFPQKKG